YGVRTGRGMLDYFCETTCTENLSFVRKYCLMDKHKVKLSKYNIMWKVKNFTLFKVCIYFISRVVGK
ncbi:hypothetical protein P9W93_14145, partial [Bacillus cereus]|nr:hypothetical protein [Bacillus cereus]